MKFLIGIFIVGCSSFAWGKDCLENRGAMDFGSGTTKVLAVSVNVCEKKIVQVLFEDRLPLAFNEAFEKSSDQKIPEKFWQDAVVQIQNSVDKLRAQDVKKISAVATAVFRNAKNGRDVILAMGKKLGLSIQVISQADEAELGFWSVLAFKGWSPKDTSVVVWDIGGGSMQMFSWNHGKPKIFKGDLASVSFKNEIIRTLQFKDPKTVSSPNPIAGQKDAAVQLAKNHGVLNVPTYFKTVSQDTHWVGIGGVLSMSVQKQVNKDSKTFTIDELNATLQRRALLSDAQLEGDYKVSDVSNLALVLGYMRALNIPQVETVPAALGQGLIYKNLH
jgi:exopolyphosphatase/guanosine-5'-triphosphate,3'-diphosphate pyrophosphatase